MDKYDFILIGTGQATGTIFPQIVGMGYSMAIIEGGRVGGTCVNYGCSPTKTLVASARAAHMARRGPDFGINTDGFTVDFPTVMRRVNNLRHSWSDGLRNWIMGTEGVTFYEGYAQFESANTVRVGDTVIEGERILIHTGGRPRHVDIPGIDQTGYLTNEGLLDLTELPRHLLMVGGSYISMEFAQAFRRLGSEVTIIEGAPQLMFREDADVAEIAREVLEAEGIRVILNAKVDSVANTDDGKAIDFTQDGQQHRVEGSHIVLAVGRVPNTDKLNLAAAGVEVGKGGFIPVNDYTQTNVPHIYAIGDVNGRGAFTHTSVNDGEILLDHLRGDPNGRKISDRNTVYAMYIDPPMARVGINEKEARESGRNILMATRPMRNISRAIEKDETAGIVKLFVDADTEQFLGAMIFGVGGDEIIGTFAAMMQAGVSYKTFRRTVINHPTVAELMPWILDDLKPLE